MSRRPGQIVAALQRAYKITQDGKAALLEFVTSRKNYSRMKRDPVAAERFFARQGFSLRRIATIWRFPDRATCEAVLRIEFSAAVAPSTGQCTGVTIPVGYRLHVRHKQLTR